MDTQFNLDRFVEAQAPVYNKVLAELEAGRKTTHWMWFIFPQIAGLGHSAMAQRYAIASADEAAAYLAHPLLGERLRECASLVAAHDDKEVADIFDPPDDLKFHSSMTLFAEIAPDEFIFTECINKFFDGVPDQATIDRL
jgi:uncharacterized protein (DUF1810 family)